VPSTNLGRNMGVSMLYESDLDLDLSCSARALHVSATEGQESIRFWSPRSSNCGDDKGYDFWFTDLYTGESSNSSSSPTTTYYLHVKGHISPDVREFILDDQQWEVANECCKEGGSKYIIVGVLLYPHPARLMYWIENPFSLLKSSPIKFQIDR